MEFQHLQKPYWGRHLWARGYFVASSGNVTDEVIAEYIRLQQEGTEPDDGGDNFRNYSKCNSIVTPILLRPSAKEKAKLCGLGLG